MEGFLIYLIKSAGLLSVFFIFYSVLLKKDTSFTTNRKFLLGGLFASVVLPAIYFTRTIIIEAPKTQFYYSESDFAITEVIPEEPVVSPLQVLFLLYLLGVLFMAARLILQLISLSRFLISGNKNNYNGAKIIETSQRVAPFSFLNCIVLNPALHSQSALTHILKHEKVHVSQAHSLDVILANLNLVYQWFNPFAWLYLKSLQQNLEYIADHEAVKQVSCKKEYQKALVKISVENLNLSLTNNFYQSLIKKRILMLNKEKSSERNNWKAGLIIPVLLGFLFLFNVKTVAQVIEKEKTTSEAKSDLEISVNINKNTKQEQLDRYTKLFEKYNVQLTLKNIKYNDAGILTSISAEFLDRNSNSSGSISRSSPDGIEEFIIYYDENRGSGFKSGKNSGSSSNYSLLTNLGEDPLIVIGEAKYTSTQLADKTIKILGRISSLAPAGAENIYGDSGKDGAILITNGEILDDFEAELKKIDLKGAPVRNEYLQIAKGKKPTFLSLSNNTSASGGSGRPNETVVIVKKNTKEGEEPVYILNGRVVNATVLDSLNTIQIDSIQVLKHAHATSIYGAKGKNGVVVIHTGNDSIKSKRFKSTTYTSAPTFVKDRRITITSARGSDNDSTQFNRSTSYVRYESDAPFVMSTDSVDINAYQYSTRTSPGNTFYLRDSGKEPLYVINGRLMGKEYDINSLDPQNIVSINVIKGKTATDKYGEKAKDGVIEVTTNGKEFQNDGTKPTFAKVSASTTKEGLKITRKQLKEQANLEVTFDDVKRNKDGLITHITISAKRNGSNASATYEVEKGIPDVFIGVRNNSVIVSSNPPRN